MPGPGSGYESEPDHDSELAHGSEPEPRQPEYGPKPKHNNAQQLDQSSPLGAVQPQTLDRTVVDTLLLAATDVLMVLAWTEMLIYAVLVWYAQDKFVDEISFSAAELISAATM